MTTLQSIACTCLDFTDVLVTVLIVERKLVSVHLCDDSGKRYRSFFSVTFHHSISGDGLYCYNDDDFISKDGHYDCNDGLQMNCVNLPVSEISYYPVKLRG